VHGGVLEPAELERLAELGRALEERFGAPQDVEWAIAADDSIYLLQSRPVTTL
jgi:pyruvate,water dikinase